MKFGVGENSRSVVPRWRPSTTFGGSPESSPVRPRAGKAQIASWFDQSYSDWVETRTAGSLADAFSAALSENRSSHTEILAREILGVGDRVPVVLQKLAKATLSPPSSGSRSGGATLDKRWQEVELIARAVSYLRKKAVAQPRNGFVWHDLSYHYLMLGELKKADKAMSVALEVSKHHRLIVRSASRFFLHIKETERALSEVAKGAGFARDPWLLSAHVAIAQGADTSSRFLKQASIVLEGGRRGIESSELGMALATEALLNGKNKVAKRLARDAIIDPTENSLAQGVWISRRVNVDTIAEDVGRAKEAYEARAWDAYYRGDWAESLEHSINWLNDQPFSSRPAVLATFVSGTFLRNFELGERVAKLSLRTNPDDWLLINNLVVALAEQDKINEAASEFSRLKIPDSKDDNYSTWLATSGLIKFRSGDIESGRKLYQRSAEISKGRKDRTVELICALYRSLEEARVGETGVAARLLMDVRSTFDLKAKRSMDESHALEALNEQILVLEAARKR